MKFSFDSLHMKRHIISYVGAFLLTLTVQGILGILFSLLHPPVFVINIACRYMYCFSALIAAILCTYGAHSRGLVKGMVSADIYTAILLLCGMIFFGNACSTHTFIKILAVSSLCGALGGVIGINIRKAG